MTVFHDVLFPLDIALNAEGGPTRRTEVVALASGREARNTPWAGSRRSYNAGYGVKSLDDIETVIAFFEARRGRLHAFRFRDPFDWKSCRPDAEPAPTDQLLGVGDGARTAFQLVKAYASGPAVFERIITKPVANETVVGVEGAAASDYTLDALTGAIVFSAPPPAGAAVTAGFLFDTPVRFDADSLRINLSAFRAGDIPSIPLIEVFE